MGGGLTWPGPADELITHEDYPQYQIRLKVSWTRCGDVHRLGDGRGWGGPGGAARVVVARGIRNRSRRRLWRIERS